MPLIIFAEFAHETAPDRDGSIVLCRTRFSLKLRDRPRQGPRPGHDYRPPRDKSFGWKSPQSQSEFVFALEECAADATLAGDVVPVWLASACPNAPGRKACDKCVKMS
jgi:hypothetical protein